MKTRIILICIFLLAGIFTGCSSRKSELDVKNFSSELSSEYINQENVTKVTMEENNTLYSGDDIESVFNGEIVNINNSCTLDLDMDGELDSVSLDISPVGDGYRYVCRLKVNDLEYSIENVILDIDENAMPLYLLTPDGEHLALAVKTRDNSYNDQTFILLYDGQKISDCIIFGVPSYYDTGQRRLFVQTLVSQLQWHSTVKPHQLVMTQDGVYEMKPDYGYADYKTYDFASGEDKVFIVAKEMHGYADCSTDAEIIPIDVDTEFVVVGGDAEEWLLIHMLKADIDCWLHMRSGFIIEEDAEIPVNEYIGNLDVVN